VLSRFVSGISQLPTQTLSIGTTGRYVRVQLSGTNFLMIFRACC
jgi:hypothetical protein